MATIATMHTAKTRHQFYLPDALSAKLDALAAKPGASKTQILSDALAAWLERGALSDLDGRFGLRLDRQSRTAERTEQKLDLLTEVLGVFVQYQMTLTAHQPSFSAETTNLGRKRYQNLLDIAGQRSAKRRSAPEPIKPKE
ncbi:ribbon-helix-helix protein, CopG family [Sphingomonas sp. PR090111-T3T-6A]|uniref:ribbon-helix-helix protein, CopG family n=1 Tax=Sphingomonas sp. PR090111-T3T-6A TaxID=685778 RepID=UPI000381A6E0|nr:ribbon-helix-helix protein, CopG family [Sphingomonas sp. PR090111-T3T-6A]